MTLVIVGALALARCVLLPPGRTTRASCEPGACNVRPSPGDARGGHCVAWSLCGIAGAAPSVRPLDAVPALVAREGRRSGGSCGRVGAFAGRASSAAGADRGHGRPARDHPSSTSTDAIGGPCGPGGSALRRPAGRSPRGRRAVRPLPPGALRPPGVQLHLPVSRVPARAPTLPGCGAGGPGPRNGATIKRGPPGPARAEPTTPTVLTVRHPCWRVAIFAPAEVLVIDHGHSEPGAITPPRPSERGTFRDAVRSPRIDGCWPGAGGNPIEKCFIAERPASKNVTPSARHDGRAAGDPWPGCPSNDAQE